MAKHILHAKIWEMLRKERVTTWKIIVLKSCNILDSHSEYYIPEIENWIFICHMFTSLGKNHCTGKWHAMFVI